MEYHGNAFLTEQWLRAKVATDGPRMSVQGAVNRAGFLLCVTMTTMALSWRLLESNSDAAIPVAFGGGMVALLIVAKTLISPALSVPTAIVYAVTKGLFLGAIPRVAVAGWDLTIVPIIIAVTVGSFVSASIVYAIGIDRFCSRWLQVSLAALVGIALISAAAFAISLAGYDVPLLHDVGVYNIGFSIGSAFIAAVCFFANIDLAKFGVSVGASKAVEWNFGLSILFLIVWIYIEVLFIIMRIWYRSAY